MSNRRLLTAIAVAAFFQAPAVSALQDAEAPPEDAAPQARITSGTAQMQSEPKPDPAQDDSGAQPSPADSTEATEPASSTGAAAPALDPSLPARAANPVVQAAADYAQYRRDLQLVRTATIDSSAALDGVMDRLAAHQPHHLSDAFIGYSALLAAQQKDFVDQVREVAEYFGREQVITGLLNDPAYVMTFKNSGDALQSALASADDEEADLLALGDRFKQKSYSLQHSDWAQQVVDRTGRLALIKAPATPPSPNDYLAALSEAGAISSTQEASVNTARRDAFTNVFDPLRAPDTPAAQPVTTVSGEPQALAEGQAGSATPAGAVTETGAEAAPTAVGGADGDTITNLVFDENETRSTNAIMTLAALEALGVGAERPDALARVMSKVRTRSCLDWAHQQLQVCVAAGHFKYEDAFCIAEHQLKDVGQCFGAVTAN